MSTPELPELDETRIARMERSVFARIAEDRRRALRRRRTGWMGAGAAAAVVVAAAVIAPSLTAALAGAPGGGEAIAPATDGAWGLSPEIGRADGAVESAGGAADAAAPLTEGREIISTGSATVVVGDVREAAAAVAADAEARGGYVESLTVGAGGEVRAATDGGMIVGPIPSPGDGWVSVRIPADELEDALSGLGELGEVTSSTVSRQDVTDQAIDVRARIEAGEASVARLTELMAQAAGVADLIAAESALAERQAALESDRQQLEWLEGQVAMSTLTVQLHPERESVAADPAGFGDGVAAGWNGLVATLNGIVIALGFLLPWVAVLAVAGVIVWAVVRIVRRIRERRRASARSAGGQAT